MDKSVVLIEKFILKIRDQMVMLDADLAALYGVETKVLLQAVKRNIKRFPDDFMFQLTVKEFHCLRSQNVTTKQRGGRRYPPYAFTEQGVAMLSSVLRSQKAINVNIEIIRTFVKLRKLLSSNRELANRLNSLEEKYLEHDEQFRKVFRAIRELMAPPKSKPRPIGFHISED